MSRVYSDTSALFALLVPTDEAHARARSAFSRLKAQEAVLVTTSYVLVETYILLQRRFGPSSVQSFREGFAPLFEVVWVGSKLHERGLDLLLRRGEKDLSLVDAVSFIVVRESRIDAVFCFDHHFEREGFTLV